MLKSALSSTDGFKKFIWTKVYSVIKEREFICNKQNAEENNSDPSHMFPGLQNHETLVKKLLWVRLWKFDEKEVKKKNNLSNWKAFCVARQNNNVIKLFNNLQFFNKSSKSFNVNYRENSRHYNYFWKDSNFNITDSNLKIISLFRKSLS